MRKIGLLGMMLLVIVLVMRITAGMTVLLSAQSPITVTHGPMLGKIGSNQVAVWARTSSAGAFRVLYGTAAGALTEMSAAATTVLEHDYTGSVLLQGLKSNTTYFYQVIPEGGEAAATR